MCCDFKDLFLGSVIQLRLWMPHMILITQTSSIERGHSFGTIAKIFRKTNISYPQIRTHPYTEFVENYFQTQRCRLSFVSFSAGFDKKI